MVETGIARSRSARCVTIDFIEILKDCLDRGMQAVQIHSVKTNQSAFGTNLFVKIAQPLHEFRDYGVAPHPRGEPAKTGERLIGILVCGGGSHVPVNAS